MATFNLPDPRDMQDTIADCLDIVHVGEDRRSKVITEALCPVSMLMDAARIASMQGQEVQAVFDYFLRSLYAQVESSARERHLSGLVSKLIEYKNMH